MTFLLSKHFMEKVGKSTLKKFIVFLTTPYLWWSNAEGGCVDVSLVSINQMQASLLCKTQVPPSGHMTELERLPPACMPTTPTEEYQEPCVFCLLSFLLREI